MGGDDKMRSEGIVEAKLDLLPDAPGTPARSCWKPIHLCSPFGLKSPKPEPWLLGRLSELNGELAEPFAARSFGEAINAYR